MIDNDTVDDGPGGGVLNEGGDVDMVNATVSGNTASSAGAIHNDTGLNSTPAGG